MKTEHRMILAAAVCVCAGCSAFFLKSDAVVDRHAFDGEYARLLKLYEAGQINLQELTVRQDVLRENHRSFVQRRVSERANPTPDPFPQNDTTTEAKCRDDRSHPDAHCAPPPGRR